MKRFLPLLGLAATALAAYSACGPTKLDCNAATCPGCCDPQGQCHAGDTALTCGFGGVLCNTCSDIQSCEGRVCVLTTADAGTDAGAADDAGTPICGRTAVACSDQAILQLDLKTTVASGLITTTLDAGVYRSIVDATAGGSPPSDSYVYAKFTATGLQKVALADQTALDTLDWDIAFRRFVIRLNGGDSGPACTAAFKLPFGTTFDSITTLPGVTAWPVDDFLSPSPSCTFMDDGSGLTTSPATALASFYSYTSCVAMTGQVFLVQTRLGRHLKLEITGYYQTEAGQNLCNGGSAPGVVGGTIRLRWAFLD